MANSGLGSVMVISLIQAPGKKNTCPEIASGASVLFRSELPATISCRLSLVVIWEEDCAVLFSSSGSPDVTGLSFSVCRVVKRFCPLAAPCHYKPKFFSITRPLPSVSFDGRGFGCLAMGPLQTAFGTSYPIPSQPLLSCKVFSLPLAAQPLVTEGI